MDEILLRCITLVGQRVAPSTPFRYLFSWWLDGDGLRSVGSVEITVGANHLAFEVGTDVVYVASLCTMASGGRWTLAWAARGRAEATTVEMIGGATSTTTTLSKGRLMVDKNGPTRFEELGCAANFGCDVSEFATLTSRQSWLMLAAPFHVAAFE
jgi:hypothetical protein